MDPLRDDQIRAIQIDYIVRKFIIEGILNRSATIKISILNPCGVFARNSSDLKLWNELYATRIALWNPMSMCHFPSANRGGIWYINPSL